MVGKKTTLEHHVEAETAQQTDIALHLLAHHTRRASEKLRRESEDSYGAVMLREREGLSYKEIARRANTSLGTIKMRIFRGRRAMLRDIRRTLSYYPALYLLSEEEETWE